MKPDFTYDPIQKKCIEYYQDNVISFFLKKKMQFLINKFTSVQPDLLWLVKKSKVLNFGLQI